MIESLEKAIQEKLKTFEIDESLYPNNVAQRAIYMLRRISSILKIKAKSAYDDFKDYLYDDDDYSFFLDKLGSRAALYNDTICLLIKHEYNRAGVAREIKEQNKKRIIKIGATRETIRQKTNKIDVEYPFFEQKLKKANPFCKLRELLNYVVVYIQNGCDLEESAKKFSVTIRDYKAKLGKARRQWPKLVPCIEKEEEKNLKSKLTPRMELIYGLWVMTGGASVEISNLLHVTRGAIYARLRAISEKDDFKRIVIEYFHDLNIENGHKKGKQTLINKKSKAAL